MSDTLSKASVDAGTGSKPKALPKCDNCGQPNPLTWTNFCPTCREAAHRFNQSEARRAKLAADAFWLNRPY